jgi:hypothetical protein
MKLIGFAGDEWFRKQTDERNHLGIMNGLQSTMMK